MDGTLNEPGVFAQAAWTGVITHRDEVRLVRLETHARSCVDSDVAVDLD